LCFIKIHVIPNKNTTMYGNTHGQSTSKIPTVPITPIAMKEN
jgi:hypothetical protein